MSSPVQNRLEAGAAAARGLAALIGLAMIVGAVACWSWRSALLLAGGLLFAWAFVTSSSGSKISHKKAE